MSSQAIDDIPTNILNILENNWPSILTNGIFKPSVFKNTVFLTGTANINKGDVSFSLYRPAIADFLQDTTKNYLVCTYSVPGRSQRSAQDKWRVDEICLVDVLIKTPPGDQTSYTNGLISRILMRNAVKRILHLNETAIPYVLLAWITREDPIEEHTLIRIRFSVNCLRYHPSTYRT